MAPNERLQASASGDINSPFMEPLYPIHNNLPNGPYPKLSPTSSVLHNIHFTDSFLGLI
jgi:hypothetical protein